LYDTDAQFAAKSMRRLARIVASADSFITISEFVKRDFERVYGTAKSVKAIHIGVRDFSAETPIEPADPPTPGFLFHLSRMSALKNVECLLAMMKLLPQRQLVLAGPRSGDSERTQRRALELGLNNVHFFFDVSTAEKAWLLQNCTALLFPSLAEGFGLPPLEALQSGKPVFLSTMTSLPEVGGTIAYYWPDFAPEAMAAVLQRGLAAWDVARDGGRARAWARRFTWTACAEAHVAEYLNALGFSRTRVAGTN
jgi:glycosyltransferase involved in cell wall biosynthesis